MTDPAPWVNTQTAARAIGVAPQTLRRWYVEGRVRPAGFTPGGFARWDVADLKRQLAPPKRTPRRPR